MATETRTPIPERLARRICSRAIADGRCSELLEALVAGGDATIDTRDGTLLIADPAGALGQETGHYPASTPPPGHG